MNNSDKIPKGSRVVMAPQPSVPIQQLPPNRALSVVLKSDEDVEWIWSPLTNGRYVSGYTIVKRSLAGRLLRHLKPSAK
jgi:hypothetical protein